MRRSELTQTTFSLVLLLLLRLEGNCYSLWYTNYVIVLYAQKQKPSSFPCAFFFFFFVAAVVLRLSLSLSWATLILQRNSSSLKDLFDTASLPKHSIWKHKLFFLFIFLFVLLCFRV
jgi:hypothetical protein